MRSARVAAVSCCALLAVPAVASADTETASSGATSATLSYDRADGAIENVRISVTRAGVRLVDEPGPRFRGGCTERCEYAPLNAHAGAKSIFVRQLDPDAEPEVLVELYTGGASCCPASRIYDFDPARGTYRRIDRNWNTSGHRGARDLDADGVAEFHSRDSRFDYRFGCGLCAPEPVRIFRLREGRLRDVTRSYPGLVRRDLRSHVRLFRKVRRDRFAARAVLAAVVADRYLLGQGRVARRTLRSAERKGYLRGIRRDFVPAGRAYMRSLLRFLRRAGYRR
jgi:hypothetical protein